MEAWFLSFIASSTKYTVLAVGLIAFTKSLALIGSGNTLLYPAWFAGTIGCLAADWLSFGIGWKFRPFLLRWHRLIRYQALIDKTGQALHRHIACLLC